MLPFTAVTQPSNQGGVTGAGAKAASVQLLSLAPQDLEPQSDLPLPHLGVNPKVASEVRGVQRVHHGRGRVPVTLKNLQDDTGVTSALHNTWGSVAQRL